MSNLYHYCETATFLSIVMNKEIWLSSLISSNDEAEGQLLTQAVLRLADADQLEPKMVEMLARALVYFETLNDALGLCLSEDADVLSQWRAYGDNGGGVAIGFDTDALRLFASSEDLAANIQLHQIKYDEQSHEEAARPFYQQLRALIDQGALNDSDFAEMLGAEPYLPNSHPEKTRTPAARLVLTLMSHAGSHFCLKHNGFREEKEWRLMANHLHGLFPDCRFRSRGARIVAYKPVRIPNASGMIREVVLGPRHASHRSLVSAALQQAGLETTAVRVSNIPYR